MKLIAIVITAAVVFSTGIASSQEIRSGSCYPGISCIGTNAQDGSDDETIGSIVPEFSFNQHFVVDGVQNLVWSRNLYAIGNTKTLFKEVFAGNQHLEESFPQINATANSAKIGELIGWRLAKRKEVDVLLSTLESTTVYAYFRDRERQFASRSVIAAFENDEAGQSISVDGAIYNNTSLGRPPKMQPYGSPKLNPFGVWLVKEMTPQVERAISVTTFPLHRYHEPIEEKRLKPVHTYLVRKTANLFELDKSHHYTGTISTTRTVNSRFYARYNLKQLPKGALVSVEALMRSLSYSGRPTPIVKLEVKKASNKLPSAANLWRFADAEPIGIWQPPNTVRLELNLQTASNIYNQRESLLLGLSTDFNECTFYIPEIIIRFVREENALFRKPLP